jgi:hypothetical protein
MRTECTQNGFYDIECLQSVKKVVVERLEVAESEQISSGDFR